jgi:hypothetical protein
VKGINEMAYGDYSGPNKAGKGLKNGSCNRTRCQCSPADWYNHGSGAWYCEDCAIDIGQDSFNFRDWTLNYYPKLGYPMFETEEMMADRAKDGNYKVGL